MRATLLLALVVTLLLVTLSARPAYGRQIDSSAGDGGLSPDAESSQEVPAEEGSSASGAEDADDADPTEITSSMEEEQQREEEEAEAEESGASSEAEEAEEGEVDDDLPDGESASEEGAVEPAEDSSEGNPLDLVDSWLTPAKPSAVARLLDTSDAEEIKSSPVDTVKRRLEILRSRLKGLGGALTRSQKKRAAGVGATDRAFTAVEDATAAYKIAYAKFEVATRGKDLDHPKAADAETREKMIAAAHAVLDAQDEHERVTKEWVDALPLVHEKELAVASDRLRLKLEMASIERRLARDIASSVSSKEESDENEVVSEAAAASGEQGEEEETQEEASSEEGTSEASAPTEEESSPAEEESTEQQQ